MKLGEGEDIMSGFKNSVQTNINSIVKGETDSIISENGIVLDLSDKLSNKLPEDLTDMAIFKTLKDIYGQREAEKLLKVYPINNLLDADEVLTSLDLVDTPNDTQPRVEAMKDLLELNHELQGTYDFDKSPIGIMANYWNKIPIFHSDLRPVFETMKGHFADHPKMSDFANWYNYIIRDGILDFSQELLEKYGVQFKKKAHKNTFGIKYQDARFVLPGVTPVEFMDFICRESIKVAENSEYLTHLYASYIREDKKNWKEAIKDARKTLIEREREKQRERSF